MDIIYKLPLPDEVCSKIFIFACKTPHTDLGGAILKKKIGLHIYNKLVKNGGIVLDRDGNVVKFNNGLRLLNTKEREQFTFDIENLKSLPKLTYIDLTEGYVEGDIAHLESVPNLTVIKLYDTHVYGEIKHLNSLVNLTEISMFSTRVGR